MTDSQQPPYTSILLICILLKNIHKNGEGIWNVCFDEVSQNTQTEGFTTVILRGALIANAPFCRFGPKYPKWEQVKGRFKEIWSDLTDSDLGKMKGSMQEAIGYLQEKYGDTKEAIEEKINDWINQNKKR